ncbi:tripeptidyl-peptidase II [Apostasia shenzhenica]|uniref:tripeptidyl-peptidase II n=1 Tax=Apostasia shenzhenica TaxID=1088818 RepID=A0A2H9ZQJ3_9ASPA|nr:tripeptidyl-peptidase II [Apostasia shenzhenica]
MIDVPLYKAERLSRLPSLLHPTDLILASPPSSLFSYDGRRRAGRGSGLIIRAMPSSPCFAPVPIFSEETVHTNKSDRPASFHLNESTFLASLMPKKEIGADRFLESHPSYDGRGVVIAIFDSGVDPAAAGLQVTSDGKPKLLDILDCTGSGDVDTSKVVKTDVDGYITGASGCHLKLHLKYPKTEDSKLKRVREDLQIKLDFLRKQDESYDDRGPIIDVVVWNDGDFWRVAIDTQSFEDGPENGKLADFVPLTNYRIERKYGIFSKLDACSFVTNVYDEGNLVSIVTDCSPHGTHVAGIASAFHPENKCDIINMSYGEPTLLPDYGRFVDLVNEVVDKHHLIFISSAGNNGPALSTVGAPGGTSSCVVGVGAYVSPAMASGAHCAVEPPLEGIEYTWSSRGPTADGDLGVCVSAPGGAVSPVPTWTLQRRMLMNGTSMASPSACGGVALLISGMKAEGIPVSPYTVRKALENTAMAISDLPAEKLTMGQGLMQVDRAYGYIQQSKNLPSICYRVLISPAGKTSPTLRGIYLRGACQQATEWTIQIEPRFHEEASNLEELAPFEECIQLRSTEKLIANAPEYLFIVIDPTNLSDGLHYHEVYGIDCKAPWRGPLFRVPITIIKPVGPLGQPPLLSYSNVSFSPGHIERRFIAVPAGATWAEATVRASGFDTARRFFIDTVQIFPLKRPIKWESVVTFSSPSLKSFVIPVKGGITMELTIAQFWSSGIGSHESTHVDFEITFHGICISRETVVLDGSEASARLEVKSLLASEQLIPSATLTKAMSLSHSYKILYKFKLDEGAEVKPRIPLLNNRIYDTKFESQFYTISDANKRIYASGDVYPKYVKVPKGEYTLQLYIRHENVQILEKMRQLVLFIERKLDRKEHITLNFFSQPDGHFTGNGSFKSSVLVPGGAEAFYVCPPSREKLPKCSSAGSVLLGSVSYGTMATGSKKDQQKHPQSPVSYQISYIIPPSKVDEDRGKDKSDSNKCVKERLEEEVRETKIRLLSGLRRGTEEEMLAWKELCASLKAEYPKYTPLLAKILDGLLSGSGGEDKISNKNEIVVAANEVIDSVDKEELAKFFSLKPDPEDEEVELEFLRVITALLLQKLKKKMELTRDQLAEAFYQKGLALADLESFEANQAGAKEPCPLLSSESDPFEENYKELKKWVDVKSSKYCMLMIVRERRNQRLGNALKVLCDLIQDESEPPKRKLYDLKIQLLGEIGWSHLVSYEKQWLHVRFPSSPFVF